MEKGHQTRRQSRKDTRLVFCGFGTFRIVVLHRLLLCVLLVWRGAFPPINATGIVSRLTTALVHNADIILPSSKYFLQALGHKGLNNMLAAYEDKTAFAVCTFAYCAGPGHAPILFQGRTQGKIVPARGPGVFGMFQFCLLVQ